MNTYKRKYYFIGPLILLVAAFIVVLMMHTVPEVAMHDEQSRSADREEIPVVELLFVQRGDYHSQVDVQGFVSSRWSGALKAEVSGKVVEVSEQLLEGARFRTGDVLLRIDDTRYRAELAQAVTQVATAEQNLALEQQRAERALEDWNRSGFDGEPDGLALRKPQLKVAKAQLNAAKLAWQNARVNLDRTQITAPYDGAVRKRQISLGDFAGQAAEVAMIYSTRTLQVAFTLSQRQMAMLSPQPGTLVMLHSTQGARSWPARISRVSQAVSLQQRQQTIYAELEQQAHMPLSGEFVTAKLAASAQLRLFKLPELAVSKSGLAWYINQQSELHSFAVQSVFVDNGYVYTHGPESLSQLQLVLSPSSHFYVGMKVQTAAQKTALIQTTKPSNSMLEAKEPLATELKANNDNTLEF